MMKVYCLFERKFGHVFGAHKLIKIFMDEKYAFKQMHSLNLGKNYNSYYIEEREIDETKNQTVICPQRKDGLINF